MSVRVLTPALAAILALAATLPTLAAGSPSREQRVAALERRIDLLEREQRQLCSRDTSARREAESVLAELRRMRQELERWLGEGDREPWRGSLDRFLRDLERRLALLPEGLPPSLSGEARRGAARAKGAVAGPGRTPPLAATGPPVNDDCAAALVIGDGSFAGDTTAATIDGEASCGASIPGPDVWFRYVAPASGEVMFNTFGSAFDTVLSLHAGCPGTPANELGCNDDAQGTQSELSRTMSLGEELLVRVGGFAGDFGSFALAAGRPAEIAGTVTSSASSFGIAGVRVAVYDAGGGWQGSATTSASGAWSVSGLRQQAYHVKASHAAYQAELYDDVPCPDYCDPTLGDPVPVGLGEVARADFALDPAAAIEGVVTDAGSAVPLPGVRVRIYGPTGSWEGNDDSGPDGAYRVAGLAPGTYFARAEPSDGYLDELFDEIDCPISCDPTTGTPIVLASGATAQADFTLQLGGSISGRVTDTSTGLPIDRARVHVFDHQGWTVDAEWTAADGSYTISGLATGTFYATGSDYEYLEELYDDIPCSAGCDPTDGTPIAVVVGAETPGVDFALLRQSAFAGLVVDEGAGVAVSDVTVVAWDDQGDWAGSGYTNATGVYSVGGLIAGSYTATAADQQGGYLGELYDDLPCADGVCDPTAGTPIAVSPAMTTTGIDFALAYGGWISGRVFETALGAPVTSRVRLWDTGGNQVADDFSTDGAYLMPGLTTGTYFVTTDERSNLHGELYDDLPCPSGCDPTAGTPVAVTTGLETADIDFGLCGQPRLLAYFPPSAAPDSFIDGCRVQVDGFASQYATGCPAVARIHWQWGDGKQGDAAFPAAHMYEPGPEYVTASVVAYDALDLASEEVEKELRLWNCLAAGACGHPETRELYNLALDSTYVLEACTEVTLGPGFLLLDPADVTIRAGDSIGLRNGVILEGGRLILETDPALLP